MNIKQQRGSGSSFFLLAVIIIFSAWFFFKLFPLYMDNMAVSGALEKITEEQDIASKKDGEIRGLLLSLLHKKDFTLFDHDSIREYVNIERFGGRIEITVEYERTKSLVGNISFLVNFKNTVEAH